MRMKKFDALYESVVWKIQENEQKMGSDFYSNILDIVCALQDNGFISSLKTPEDIAKRIYNTEGEKALVVGGDEKSYLRSIKVTFLSPAPETFEVKAQVLSPDNSIEQNQVSKQWQGQDPETIRKELIDYIEQTNMKAQTGDAAVQDVPVENGSQPGAQQGTALPTNASMPAEQQPPTQ